MEQKAQKPTTAPKTFVQRLFFDVGACGLIGVSVGSFVGLVPGFKSALADARVYNAAVRPSNGAIAKQALKNVWKFGSTTSSSYAAHGAC